ncbi:MerR family transcriptional regulator [Secundilactobacillus mixtipabuli]|uniref:MerR family transcriptional regulator n=1 Tax=Secundilactobacillus mixtipabuli TaxID=1435342 RepID=A0A1Z5I9S9_9LACO|nr:MerR family transcriptional regulator [Secundilactobacillus mixtipabuli]GAW98499.1 MerR family transcriptional regulator [Secundilactobacillus mixtipabuli]
MLNHYKIGEIANYYHVSAQTIRDYEAKGLIQSQRNPDTSYRYFGYQQTNQMSDIMQLREYQFSLKQISQLVTQSDIQDTICLYDKQAVKIQKTIEHLQANLLKLDQASTTLKHVKQNFNYVQFTVSPALYFDELKNYGQDDMFEPNHKYQSQRLNQLEGLAAFPVGFIFQIDISNYLLTPTWGLLANKKLPQFDNSSRLLPPKLCMHAFLVAGREGTLKSAYDQLIDKLTKKLNLVIIDQPFGRIILRCHENGEWKRYFELWCPVSEDCYNEYEKNTSIVV